LYIINEIKPLPLIGKSAVAIGKFDGIHIGHQALLEKIKEKKQEKMTIVVFTFSPSPEEFFRGESIPCVDTIEEKRDNFAGMGVDYLIEYPLTKESASISPEDFMNEILLKNLNAGYIVSGKDLSFGDKGRGNSRMLAEFAMEHDITYEVIDKVCLDGKEVSSTAVRNAIEEGNMELVGKMLGRYYSIVGTVVKGNQLGRTMQMPTVNVVPSQQKLLPPKGVYATITTIDGVDWKGITNIGYKPTVSNNQVIGVETHLFDFSRDIYGKEIKTKFISYMRPEKKFGGVDELTEQLRVDREKGIEFFHKMFEN